MFFFVKREIPIYCVDRDDKLSLLPDVVWDDNDTKNSKNIGKYGC